MDFAQNFASTEGFTGLLAQSNTSPAKVPVPPTQTQPTKSAARRVRQKAKEEANTQARINAAMASVQLAPHPPFPLTPYHGSGLPPSPAAHYRRSNSAHHHSNGSNGHNSPDSQRAHHTRAGICGATATYMATLEQPTLIVASNVTL